MSFKFSQSFLVLSIFHWFLFFIPSIFYGIAPRLINNQICWASLRETCRYSELFLSVFSHIRTGYGEIQSICPYSVRMRENTDKNNSEWGHILRSEESQEILETHCYKVPWLTKNQICSACPFWICISNIA